MKHLIEAFPRWLTTTAGAITALTAVLVALRDDPVPGVAAIIGGVAVISALTALHWITAHRSGLLDPNQRLPRYPRLRLTGFIIIGALAIASLSAVAVPSVRRVTLGTLGKGLVIDDVALSQSSDRQRLEIAVRNRRSYQLRVRGVRLTGVFSQARDCAADGPFRLSDTVRIAARRSDGGLLFEGNVQGEDSLFKYAYVGETSVNPRCAHDLELRAQTPYTVPARSIAVISVALPRMNQLRVINGGHNLVGLPPLTEYDRLTVELLKSWRAPSSTITFRK